MIDPKYKQLAFSEHLVTARYFSSMDTRIYYKIYSRVSFSAENNIRENLITHVLNNYDYRVLLLDSNLTLLYDKSKI